MAMTTTLNITLLSLEKGSEYTVTVVGVNEAGPGDPQIAAPVQTAVDGEHTGSLYVFILCLHSSHCTSAL